MKNWADNVMKATQAREVRESKKRKPDLGDTSAGQAIATGPFRENEERSGPEHQGTWKFRTYRKTGAAKGRGKTGGIRK